MIMAGGSEGSVRSTKSTSTAETLIAPGTPTVVSDAHSTVPTTQVNSRRFLVDYTFPFFFYLTELDD